MSLIQTLLGFLSLKTRPEDFPEAKVSGEITRSLAILNGLSDRGLRTVQVDRAGNLNIRSFDLSKRDNVQYKNITTTALFNFNEAQVHLWDYGGWFKDPTHMRIKLTRGASGRETHFIPDISGAYHDGVNAYLWISGKEWATADYFSVESDASAWNLQVYGYNLPEQ